MTNARAHPPNHPQTRPISPYAAAVPPYAAFVTACRAAGTACRAAGTACRAAGTACRAAGTACRAAGTACRAVGTACRAFVAAGRALVTVCPVAAAVEPGAGVKEPCLCCGLGACVKLGAAFLSTEIAERGECGLMGASSRLSNSLGCRVVRAASRCRGMREKNRPVSLSRSPIPSSFLFTKLPAHLPPAPSSAPGRGGSLFATSRPRACAPESRSPSRVSPSHRPYPRLAPMLQMPPFACEGGVGG